MASSSGINYAEVRQFLPDSTAVHSGACHGGSASGLPAAVPSCLPLQRHHHAPPGRHTALCFCVLSQHTSCQTRRCTLVNMPSLNAPAEPSLSNTLTVRLTCMGVHIYTCMSQWAELNASHRWANAQSAAALPPLQLLCCALLCCAVLCGVCSGTLWASATVST